MNEIELGVYCGLLTMFINYTLGKPSSEFSPYEIFSFYSVWLAKRRLKQIGLLQSYRNQYEESKQGKHRKYELIELKNDYKKILYNAAEPFFGWERAVGMCPVCTGVWIAGGVWLSFSQNLLDLVIIIIISHVVIRLMNKFL